MYYKKGGIECKISQTKSGQGGERSFWYRYNPESSEKIHPEIFRLGDVLLLQDDQARNQWPTDRIIKKKPGQHEIVQSVKLKAAGSKSN